MLIKLYNHPMPENLDELKIRIPDACESGGMQTVFSVWSEDYRFDVCVCVCDHQGGSQ
jgi:hypothetical protein